MIQPDTYIDEYYQINSEKIFRPPKNKFNNLNFSRLTAEKKIVNICIEIMIHEKLIIKERIDWDLNDEKRCPELFANKLVQELSGIINPDLLEYNQRIIKNQILDGLLEHIDRHTFLPKLKLIKKDNEISNNQICPNCSTVLFNQEYCVNCMYVFEKKLEKKPSEKIEVQDEFRQTERQRILELRQKNVNAEEIAVAYSQEGKDKKICKKCSEVNLSSSTECRNCKFKFPVISYFDINLNDSYVIHFWDKINRNSTIQQLKNFSDFFSAEDFNSLKYLFNKIKFVLKGEFEQILTEEAFSDLIYHVEKYYFSFSNPTHTSEKIFDSSYYNKFSKVRPHTKMMNFNLLPDIKEGWLPDTLPNKNYEEKKEEKAKILDPSLKRKRGRPKKMEIFKIDVEKMEENYITVIERDNLMKTDIISEEDLHYDFCGKCDDEGKLICCETCSSAYHFECLGYDKFPRGKFKCYFCKIIKLGIDEAVTVDKSQMKIIKKLITYNRKAKWHNKASEFLEVMEAHHCSCFFKNPVSLEFTEFYQKVKEPRDLRMISENLKNKKYSCLKEFIKELALVWSGFKEFYKPNSFFYKQAETMENYMTHLIKEEGIFDSFEPHGDRGSSRSQRVNYRERADDEDFIEIDEESQDKRKESESLNINVSDEEQELNEIDELSEKDEGNLDVIIEN